MPRPSSFFPSAGLTVLVLTALLLLCFNTAVAQDVTAAPTHDDDHDHVTPAPTHDDDHDHVTPAPTHDDDHDHVTPAPTHDDDHDHVEPEPSHDDSDHGEPGHDESDHGEHSHDESDHGESGHDDHGHEGHDHDHAHEDGHNDDTLKGVALVVIFVIAVAFGFLPEVVPGFASNKTAMSAAQTFSGGVFLATALAHMLPNSTQALRTHLGDTTFNKYNPSFILCAAGYFLLLGLQRVVLKNSFCPVHMASHPPATEEEEIAKKERIELKTIVISPHSDEKSDMELNAGYCDVGTPVKEQPEELKCEDSHIHTHDTHSGGFVAASSYTLMVMLTCHGIIEGIALGLQKGSTDIGLLWAAIACHKWAESISLGSSLLTQDVASRIRVALIVSFSAGTPIGIAIGWLLVSSVHISVVGYFVSISAGTFVYLSLSEVVPAEFKEGVRNFLAFATFLVGFGAYYIVTIFTAHEH